MGRAAAHRKPAGDGLGLLQEPQRRGCFLTPLRIAIAGAGFSGLASAMLLARAGHRVTVHEKFDEPRSVGAGILLQPTGLAVLEAMGLSSRIVPLGAKVSHLYGVTPTGRPVVDVHYRDWREDAFGLGLHRTSLFDALWDGAKAAGVEVLTGQVVNDLRELEADSDVAVIADGARSSLRSRTGLASRDRQYPWGAVWAVLDDPGASRGPTLWQWYRGAREMLGIMPTGQAPGHAHPVVSMFWSLHEDAYPAFQAAGLDAFKRGVRALNPHCTDLLDQLQSPDQLTWARYRDVSMPRYNTDRAVVIGDAAHATSPQLGQGTNLALIDAWTLAKCLSQDRPVAQSLADYSKRRHRHTRFYCQASRWMTPGFQSHRSFIPWVRDLVFAPSAKWPVAGPFTCSTLTGMQQSWWPFGAGSRLGLSDLLQ